MRAVNESESSQPAPQDTTGKPAEANSNRPLVLVALPRIVDLVIQQDRALAPALFSQRQPSYAIRRHRLLSIVDLDELGLDETVSLPPEIVLVAQPRQRRLASLSQHELQQRTWRLAYQALIVLRLQERIDAQLLGVRGIHERIDTIGRHSFSEIEAVLRREHRLLDGDEDLSRIYIEFAALFAELLHFTPIAIDTFFPSLAGKKGAVRMLLENDLDLSGLLESVRPAGAPDPSTTQAQAEALEDQALEAPPALPRPNQKLSERLLRWGERAYSRGNAVVAAMLYRRGARLSEDADTKKQAQDRAHAIIDSLVSRLQSALNFDAKRGAEWRLALMDLFRYSNRGFWGPNKRLLYDLQKVCVDQERQIHTVDFWKYLRSVIADTLNYALWLGRSTYRVCQRWIVGLWTPENEPLPAIKKEAPPLMGKHHIKRPLPNQREVLMSKHLRSAAGRLAKAQVSSAERERLSRLLQEAAASAESQLRRHLRPRIARSLNERGLRPANLPERVARDKLIEELLDCIVSHGYLTLGDVRDAISRSQLKLSDLSLEELWQGDAILRADARLNRLLDGVYRRGQFYLRGLQWLSSLGFGRAIGRFLMRYLAVPYGGAWVGLYALDHLWEKLFNRNHAEVPVESGLAQTMAASIHIPIGAGFDIPNMLIAVFITGSFFLGLLYVENFRHVLRAVIQTVSQAVRSLIIEFPKWLLAQGWARLFLRSRVAKVLRRYLVTPLLPATIDYFVLSLSTDFNRTLAIGSFLLIFTALNFFLNSRYGREFEELVGAWLARTWYHFRVQIIRSVFDFIMWFFRRLIELTEKLLYAIDEWLLFKTGETRFSLILKGVLGTIWSLFAYGVRFCITLLVEPQINPIKHFPVVTVSHKIILPMQPVIAGFLKQPLGFGMAQTVAGAIVFLTPGIFGFLVWELKSNWKLYEANRDTRLKPSGIGPHGETLTRLLKPGFHSGAIPRLYSRMRRAERQSGPLRRRQTLTKCQNKLRENEVAFQHFVEREFLEFLRRSPAWNQLTVHVSNVTLGPNSIEASISCPERSPDPLVFHFDAQRDWLVVRVIQPGWLPSLHLRQRAVLDAALAGFYALSGVEISEEQLQCILNAPGLVYHPLENDIVFWVREDRQTAITYHLRTWGTIRPYPNASAKALGLKPLLPKQLLYAENPIPWKTWVDYWEHKDETLHRDGVIEPGIGLLPGTRIASFRHS